MNSTTTKRNDDLLTNAWNRASMYSGALGHMQGTALASIFLLQTALKYAYEIDPVTRKSIQDVIDAMQAAYNETQDPEAFEAARGKN